MSSLIELIYFTRCTFCFRIYERFKINCIRHFFIVHSFVQCQMYIHLCDCFAHWRSLTNVAGNVNLNAPDANVFYVPKHAFFSFDSSDFELHV